jgi:solute:Na+ symporter, SSS family
VTTPLLVIVAFIVVSAAVGLAGRGRGAMNIERWSVGGRRFGVVLIWLLMAGEIYTTFTFLGASGWAYSRGAPSFYIIAYGAFAYVISFFLIPPVWRLAKQHGLHTQPDFFELRYNSRLLAGLVAVVGVLSIVPYLQLQLAGLGLIVQLASGGSISSSWAIVLGFVLTAAFVYTSGLTGIAWVAIIKDVAMVVAVMILGFGLPSMYFGGIGPMFTELARQHPAHLVLPGATANYDVVWTISTIVMTGMGFYCWPHMFASTYSAKDEHTIRRNAIIMPLYQLPILLVFFVGFTALLVIPGLKQPDAALLTLVTKSYPPWFAGFVGGAGAVTAMVPSAMLLLGASTLIAKNVYRPLAGGGTTDAQLMRVSRVSMLVVAGIALVLALWSPKELVLLLLFGYDGVTQFFPGVVLAVATRRVTAAPIAAGLVAGELVVVFLLYTGRDPFFGLNAGFVALAVNVAVTLAAWAVVEATSPERPASNAV